MNMKRYLNSEYPFYYKPKIAFLIGGIILLLSTLFSVLFEPFEVNFKELKFSYFTISFIHALLSFVIFITAAFILNSFRKENQVWKVKNEFVFLIMVLIIIGVFQFLIRDFIYAKNDNWSFRYLYEEIRNTVLVGSLLIFVITSINIQRLINFYESRGKRIKTISGRNNVDKYSSRIHIKTQVKSDDFSLDIKNFIFAKSDKNYIEFYFKDETILLKRITIKSLENQLRDYNFIIKTHRSYLINLKYITTIKGNAQGYKLIVENSDVIVPVSRTMIENFENRLRDLS
ncbi:LytTR family transcriptional regulator [Tenacibaculum sp. 190524A02b]